MAADKRTVDAPKDTPRHLHTLLRIALVGLGTAAAVPLALTVPWAEVWTTITRVSPSLLAAAVLLMIVFYALEAVRWSCILGGRVPARAAFRYSRAAYLTTAIVPLQMGELIKPALLRSQHQIPYGDGLLSVVIGRVLDVFTILLLGTVAAAVLLLTGNNIGEAWLMPLVSGLLAAGLAGVLAGALVLSVVARSRNTHLITWKQRLPGRVQDVMNRAAASFSASLDTLRSPRRIAMLALLCLLMWTVNFAKVYVLFMAFGLPASPWVVLLGFVLVTLGLTLPIVPGYVGQYEALWTVIFVWLTPISTPELVALGILAHAVILVTVLALGVPSLWWLSSLLPGIAGRGPIEAVEVPAPAIR